MRPLIVGSLLVVLPAASQSSARLVTTLVSVGNGGRLLPLDVLGSRPLESAAAVPQDEFGDTYECGDDPPTAYASFIDPSSLAWNYAVTGKSGWLYYTQFNPPDCNTPGTYDRDLVRIPIELAIEPSR